jgi:hypothetical protein
LIFAGSFACIGLSFLLVQPPAIPQAAPLLPETPFQRGSSSAPAR